MSDPAVGLAVALRVLRQATGPLDVEAVAWLMAHHGPLHVEAALTAAIGPACGAAEACAAPEPPEAARLAAAREAFRLAGLDDLLA